jgi:beta-mannosidase
VDLGGQWLAAVSTDERRQSITSAGSGRTGDGGGEQWNCVEVPGHWQDHPALAGVDGPVLYRRDFAAEAPGPGERAFLAFSGIFYQGDVWLDGEYLGDTEGYFVPHAFEVTEALAARDEHVLTVEVSCSRPGDLRAKRNLTGLFQHSDCIDPDWNPGGIWAPVGIERCGPVRLAALQVLCREASVERAVLDLDATLVPDRPRPVRIDTTVAPEDPPGEPVRHHQDHTLSEGANRVRWRVVIEAPQLWWPRALGPQPLYEVQVSVSDPDGRATDGRVLLTGLRQVRLRNFVASVNGERLFLKGANLAPTRRDLAAAPPAEIERDVALAVDAGLDLLRVQAHVARPELYEAADRAGMLLWQDLPLQWGYGRVRRQAVVQARRAVEVLGHHPSIAWWCGHNEPAAVDFRAGRPPAAGRLARGVAAQMVPTWNRTGLDRSIRRALERSDGSRPVIPHAGVLPHPLWGTDSHLWFGWYHGADRDLERAIARFPMLGRFLGEFGAQAIPESAGFMHPERWPHLDWEELAAHHCLQKEVFDQRVPPAAHPTFESWREATQAYQASLLRHHIETLRRLKYRPTGGFTMSMLADAQPAVTWAVLDHERVAKAGYRALAEACAPVIVVASALEDGYRPGAMVAVDVHVVSDLRAPIEGAVATARLTWPGGRRAWRFGGDIPADRCVRIGRLSHTLPATASPGQLALELGLDWAGGRAANRYTSTVDGAEGGGGPPGET